MGLSNDESTNDETENCNRPCRREVQEAFDREFFGAILKRGSCNPDVLRRQAELVAHQGDYVAALELDRTLAARYPNDPVVHYNLTCSLSMTGHHREAVATLAKAIELGYADYAHIDADADLDPLRDLPSFQELMRRWGPADPQGHIS